MNNTLFRQRIFITGMFLALAGGIMAQTAGHAVPVTVTDKGGKAAIALPSDTTKTDSIDRDMTLGELVVKADRVRRRPGGYTVSLTGSGLAKGKDMNRMLASLPGLAIENGSLPCKARHRRPCTSTA